MLKSLKYTRVRIGEHFFDSEEIDELASEVPELDTFYISVPSYGFMMVGMNDTPLPNIDFRNQSDRLKA